MAVAAVAPLDPLLCRSYQFVSAFTGKELWLFEWGEYITPTLAQLHTYYRAATEDWFCDLMWTDGSGMVHRSTLKNDFQVNMRDSPEVPRGSKGAVVIQVVRTNRLCQDR